MKTKYVLLIILSVILVGLSLPEVFHKNQGKSQTIGSVRDGSLENAWLVPYSGPNYRYFSLSSYYLANNAYLHSDIHDIILSAYEICSETCPDVRFRLMECSDKNGGKLLIHRTHQNGTSADFMVPKTKNGHQVHRWDRLGFLHYLLDFDKDGALLLEKTVKIDFESVAQHILALDEAAQQKGWRIRKVILKINLQDELMQTPSGKKLKSRGIYFVQSLTPFVDKVHDDHYHIDFVPL